MEYLIFFIVLFLLIVIIYNVFVIRKERALSKMKTNKEVIIFTKLNNINVENIDLKKLVRILSFSNAFIISLMATIVLILKDIISNFYLWILGSAVISFVLLIPLILGIYKLVGKIFKKEGK